MHDEMAIILAMSAGRAVILADSDTRVNHQLVDARVDLKLHAIVAPDSDCKP
jgi:hypothetical protein